MRKSELVNEISQQTGVAKVDVLMSLQAAIEIIKKEMKAGGEVTLRGFGTFCNKKRAAKKGRLIKKNAMLDIPEHSIPYFRPSKEWREEVKELSLKGEG